MASRGRTAMASNHSDRSCDSSPDPLAMSAGEHSNTIKLTQRTTNHTPLSTRSPSKPKRTLDFSQMDFESPAKSMVLNTPRAGGASPWRIKVTVQAEPGSDEENTMSPSVKRVTRTKTTTVPLKDPDAKSPVKRPRGRPRKSDTDVAVKPKRNGTPSRKARSKSRDASLEPTGSSAADVDTDVPPKKRRGRTRKSIQPPTEAEEPLVVQDAVSEDEMLADLTPVPATRPNDFSSTKSTRFKALGMSKTVNDATGEWEHAERLAGNTPRTNVGSQIRARKGTPHAKKVVLEPVTIEEDSEGSDLFTPSSGEDEPEPRPVVYDMAMRNDQHTNVAPDQILADEETLNVDKYVLDEGTTRMLDDTTVLDSENFTMISVDSLPSNGAFSSPPKPEESHGTAIQSIASQLQTTPESSSSAAPRVVVQPSSPHASTTSTSVPRLATIASNRYTTPVPEEIKELSAPPAIQSALPTIPKAETPQLGRVVTAGVALQGLVDPNRTTPDPSQKALDEKHDRLDDLFRGFSEGTRKELQAGLRLGEQLADSQSKLPSPAASSPIKQPLDATSKEGVFRTHRKHRSRLLTPDERQESQVEAVEQSTAADDVQYPSLEVDDAANSLISPASSTDEMSWRVDSPTAQTTGTESNSHQQIQDAKITTSRIQQDDYADIWQEEASRSSNLPDKDPEPTQTYPQEQDLFADIATSVPSRGKPARIRQHKTSLEFASSDGTTSPQQFMQLAAGPIGIEESEPGVAKTSSRKVDTAFEDRASDDGNEDSDDTGMFFQSNMPNAFQKVQPYERMQRTSDRVSLSSLLEQGESFLPESSPPAIAKEALPAPKTNPFQATPPRFPGFPCSPSKSSPLRREIRGSDISSDSIQQIQDESSLPIIQSSPFRTIVDGESMLSTASDQRQFRAEMEGTTDSSILRVRGEADEYLDAYEQQDRSLNEITEVTEPSRTWYKESPAPTSSTRRPLQNLVQRQQSSGGKSTHRFSNHRVTGSSPAHIVAKEHIELKDEVPAEGSGHEDTEEISSPEEAPRMSNSAAKSSQQRLEPSSRSSLNVDAFRRRATPIAHPILSRHAALPKIEPWTKTHYKTLDKLYSTHLKHPTLFLPSLDPPTPLSDINKQLMQTFLAANGLPYVGATFSAWGYSMVMTESLVVLCAVFVELLSLEDIGQYEAQNKTRIEIGDCALGRIGDVIHGEEVARRLATVVLGEDVRRDEKKGLRIDRSKTLTISWPH